jgi:hypothetical protein
MPPFSPRVGGLPGGLTPGFAAPMPPSEWTFAWNGFMSASAQYGINHRQMPAPGQSSTVFHVPPQTVDEYQSFVGTSAMPGQWVAMNFKYGNRDVAALITLSTWNPSEPTTYYALGSQNFIQNAYITYDLPAAGRLKTHATFGYFYNNYGNLGQYGPGIYQSPITGGPRGVGEDVLAEIQLSPSLMLTIEEGFMGNRSGHAPSGTTPAGANNASDPLYPASFIPNLHVGIIKSGTYVWRANLHALYNFAMDDTVQRNCFLQVSPGSPPGTPGTFMCQRNTDNMVTRGVDESYIPDGHITVLGADASVSHPIWGLLGVGAAHIDAVNAYLLRGLLTYGGEGQPLTERWLGLETNGTGSVDVAGINYQASLGRIVSAPLPIDPNGPDVILNAGAIVAVSHTTNPVFDGRVRYKFGLDALYSFLPWMSAGARFDHVVPTSKDSGETFNVLLTRLVFKTDWASRESISLIYARWFYGPRTHPEFSVLQQPWLDDQLVALNVNMWW